MAIQKIVQVKIMQLTYQKKIFDIEYFHRQGQKQTILFIHGLGGSKENFWDACKAKNLIDHTLICFDHPGVGFSTYYEDLILNVDDIVEITSLFIEQLNIANCILAGASMGGLISLLYLKKYGFDKIKGYINIEGNLLPEDCMFSSKVVPFDYNTFANKIFDNIIIEMKKNGNTGYHITANNMQLNTNIKAYYNYSFQTVDYSSTGELLTQFLNLNIPKIFIYGDENKTLSYIPSLIEHGVNVKAILNSNHFVFYDNPKDLYTTIADFINTIK